jgi:ribosome maturation factor RimP
MINTRDQDRKTMFIAMNEKKIIELIHEHLDGTDRFLVDLVIKPGNRILVFIDSDTAITIDHCVELSRHIEKNLDREIEDFELNVSSSGLDQPFRLTRQYIKNIGRDVSVVCNDGSRLSGKLIKANETEFELLEQKKEKKIITEVNHILRYADVKETKEIIKF